MNLFPNCDERENELLTQIYAYFLNFEGTCILFIFLSFNVQFFLFSHILKMLRIRYHEKRKQTKYIDWLFKREET